MGGLLLDKVALSGFGTASPPELSGEGVKAAHSAPFLTRTTQLSSLELKCYTINLLAAAVVDNRKNALTCLRRCGIIIFRSNHSNSRLSLRSVTSGKEVGENDKSSIGSRPFPTFGL